MRSSTRPRFSRDLAIIQVADSTHTWKNQLTSRRARLLQRRSSARETKLPSVALSTCGRRSDNATFVRSGVQISTFLLLRHLSNNRRRLFCLKTPAHGRATRASHSLGRADGDLKVAEEDRKQRDRLSFSLLGHDRSPASNIRPDALVCRSLHLGIDRPLSSLACIRAIAVFARRHRLVSEQMFHASHSVQ